MNCPNCKSVRIENLFLVIADIPDVSNYLHAANVEGKGQ